MSVQTTRKTICDRCGNEVHAEYWEIRIGKLKWKRYKKTHIGRLSWMKLQNGSGSMLCDMELDLCVDCSELFHVFMSNK